jgi:hypothetical protein
MASGSQPHNPGGREIREEESYKSDMARLRLSYQAIDIAFEDVSLALSRRPDIFPQVPGAININLRRLKVTGCADLPELAVWFTFDDNFVHMLNIDELEDEE